MIEDTQNKIDELVENMRGMNSIHIWEVLSMIREKSELDLVMRTEGKTPMPFLCERKMIRDT